MYRRGDKISAFQTETKTDLFRWSTLYVCSVVQRTNQPTTRSSWCVSFLFLDMHPRMFLSINVCICICICVKTWVEMDVSIQNSGRRREGNVTNRTTDLEVADHRWWTTRGFHSYNEKTLDRATSSDGMLRKGMLVWLIRRHNGTVLERFVCQTWLHSVLATFWWLDVPMMLLTHHLNLVMVQTKRCFSYSYSTSRSKYIHGYCDREHARFR